MNKLFIIASACLVTGLALGAWLSTDEAAPAVAETPQVYFDPTAPLDERLAALERVVAQERDARAVLEEQIMALLEEIDRIDAEGPAVIASEVAQMNEMRARADTTSSPPGPIEAVPQDYRDQQIRQLVAGGFSDARAQWIVDQTTQYQYDAMRARYEARQSGERISDPTIFDPDARLRATLGDREYEDYLAASGRPTSVSVQSIMASSPASAAGLQPGDQIQTYDGQRIFNTRELQMASFNAPAGTSVTVEVMRNGMPITMTLPAGPLGVTIVGSNRRRGN